MLSPNLQAELRKDSVIDNRFTISKQIDGNPHSNAAVFEAFDDTTQQNVALKTYELSDEQDDILCGPTRFARELQASVSIRHPRVLEIIGCGVLFEDSRYTASPMANQGTLESANIDVDSLEGATQVWNIALDIAEGIDAVHKKGYIHGDITPANMFVNNYRGWLGDFGLVCAINGSELSRKYPFDRDLIARSCGAAVATPHYAAPEQMSESTEAALEPASDIFPWAVSTLHMINGKHPYTKSGVLPTNLNFNAAYDYATRVKVRPRPDLPIGLYDLISYCLKRHPSQRPQDLAEIVGVGRTILNLEAVSDTE